MVICKLIFSIKVVGVRYKEIYYVKLGILNTNTGCIDMQFKQRYLVLFEMENEIYFSDLCSFGGFCISNVLNTTSSC